MSNLLSNKLSHYAVDPPEKVWESIADALDEKTNPLSLRLSQYEATPSGQVWNKINEQLSAKTTTVVPFFQKYKKVLRYAVAAVLLITIGLAVNTYVAGNHEPVVISQIPVNTPDLQTASPEVQNENENERSDDNQHVLLANTHSAVQENESIEEIKKSFLPTRSKASTGPVFSNAFIPKTAEVKHAISSELSDKKYMVYSDEEGNAMKLSKKLFDLVACAKEKVLCKEQLLQLQQKLAATSLSTDFTGVLEIITNLNEK